jgi:hypothetical protein
VVFLAILSSSDDDALAARSRAAAMMRWQRAWKPGEELEEVVVASV